MYRVELKDGSKIPIDADKIEVYNNHLLLSKTNELIAAFVPCFWVNVNKIKEE